MYLAFRRRAAVVWALCATVSLYACDISDPPPKPGKPLPIAAAGLTTPENVLSARIVFELSGADSVRVVYATAGEPVQATPYRAARVGADTIIVLGLLPEHVYQYQIEATANGETLSSDGGTFETGQLPAVLRNMSLVNVTGHPSQYSLTNVNGYAVVFDSTGRVVWYHDFTGEGGSAWAGRLGNGDYFVSFGTSTGWQPLQSHFVEFTPEGREVRRYDPPLGYYLDTHELLVTGSGPTKRAHFFTYTIREMNLTFIGGGSDVQTAGHQIMRTDGLGAVEFTWDAWQYISPEEWLGEPVERNTRTSTDFDHPNALTFDANGDYVVSWRNLNQITAISSRTGQVLWRLGGAKGEYRFVDDPLNGFSKQHAVKILPNGDILLFDNGTDHVPPQSRAVEYRLDHVARTATLVWQSQHDPMLFAEYVGWVDRLPNGNTFVGYTFLGRVIEASPTGAVVWEGQLRFNNTDIGAYRIIPIPSLY